MFTDRVNNIAKQQNIPVSFEKPDKFEMDKLVKMGVELFIAAEYPWKIPIPDALKYAVNVHPTMLPEGRGLTPLPWLLLAYPEHAGITLHKMTNRFDQGDILLQKKILLDDLESYDTLTAKLYIETPILLNELLTKLDHYCQHASKQDAGTHWEKISRTAQTIDWHQSTSTVLKQIRAFGSLGVYAQLAAHNYLITAAEGVEYQHQFNAGDLILIDQIRLVIATKDGVISMPRNGLLVVD